MTAAIASSLSAFRAARAALVTGIAAWLDSRLATLAALAASIAIAAPAPTPRQMLGNPVDFDAASTVVYPLGIFDPASIPLRTDFSQWQDPNCGPCAFIRCLALRRPDAIPQIVGEVGNGNYWIRETNGQGRFVYWELTKEFNSRLQCAPHKALWGLAIEKFGGARSPIGMAGMTSESPFQFFRMFGLLDRGLGGWDYAHNPQTSLPNTDAGYVALIQSIVAKRQLAFAGTGGDDFDGQLIPDHWYYIIEVDLINGEWYALMGNPWGEFWDVALHIADLRKFGEIQIGEFV